MRVLGLFLVSLACAAALPAAPSVQTARAPAAYLAPVGASNIKPLPALRGGGLPPTDVIVKTCIGGAIGAFARAFLQNMVPEISKYGPWKHIVGVNMLGALLLGIVTSPSFPKDLAPVFVPACRIISAIITVDAYGLYQSGKETESGLYFAFVVPFNLLMNHIGRTVIAPKIL
eukprot:CAMPEP_0173437842 /NCGR_PEP_ID=MMETSP1357-20121228/18550_1 /TAXON_ID=77926 /ORGANISM="Hemiselmis rufescens, Strain PCC563" /LENGTH=172 /DNA_ID=CAMNT_0014403049 /DNA_START=20 /DNA_END=538 /DNA_ORIENTATION=+